MADTHDDTLLGRVSPQRFQRLTGQAEISCWTAPAARGRGICPAAVDAATAWTFGEIGLVRVELLHFTANPASCRVAGKAGYAVEGTRHRAMRHLDGWHDTRLHARVR
ncbi:GNAT family N-acetyltransferase [Streptomyces abyssomicinicus]|uniref:GNAT family N-acetyltransferase n=1 Tax=Streptomyces abyssomicinicus TaxID=574929 RepID=UPI001FE6D61D|nr:GNAT family protein [Streptomyces abyssomicinicus]